MEPYLPEVWHAFSVTRKEFDELERKWYEVCSPKCYIEKIESILLNDMDTDIEEIDEMTVEFARRLVESIKMIK